MPARGVGSGWRSRREKGQGAEGSSYKLTGKRIIQNESYSMRIDKAINAYLLHTAAYIYRVIAARPQVPTDNACQPVIFFSRETRVPVNLALLLYYSISIVYENYTWWYHPE